MWQTPEICDVVDHLEPLEYAGLISHAKRCGIEFGLWFGGFPVIGTVTIWTLSLEVGVALFCLYAFLMFWFFKKRYPRLRRRNIELLCESQWARGRGYTVEGLMPARYSERLERFLT